MKEIAGVHEAGVVGGGHTAGRENTAGLEAETGDQGQEVFREKDRTVAKEDQDLVVLPDTGINGERVL